MLSGTSLRVPQSGMLQVLVLFTYATGASARAIPRATDETVLDAGGALAVSIPHPDSNCPECGQRNGESGAASAILRLPLHDETSPTAKRISSRDGGACESSHMTAEVRVNSRGDVTRMEMEISTDNDDACDPSTVMVTGISFSHSVQRTPGSVLHAVVSGDSESTPRIIVTLRTNATVQSNVTLPGDSEKTPTTERASTGTEDVAGGSFTGIADLRSSLKPTTTAANQTEPVAVRLASFFVSDCHSQIPLLAGPVAGLRSSTARRFRLYQPRGGRHRARHSRSDRGSPPPRDSLRMVPVYPTAHWTICGSFSHLSRS